MYDTEDDENFENSFGEEIDLTGYEEDDESGELSLELDEDGESLLDDASYDENYSYTEDTEDASYDDAAYSEENLYSDAAYSDGSSYDEASLYADADTTYDDMQYSGGETYATGEEAYYEEAPVGAVAYAAQQASKKKSPSALFIILLLMIMALGGVAGATYVFKGTFDVMAWFEPAPAQPQKTIEDIAVQKETDDFFADAVKQGGDPDGQRPPLDQPLADKPEQPVPGQAAPEKPVSVAVVAPPTQVAVDLNKTQDGQVAVPVRMGGRSEPFYPIGYRMPTVSADINDYPLAPAVPSYEMADLDRLNELTQITVSGILYDTVRPSAIIKAGKVDHLVHKGDVVEGCKIVDITRNEVVIKTGNNVFKANIGQAVTTAPSESVAKYNYNQMNDVMAKELIPVDMMSQKGLNFNSNTSNNTFGGAYRPASRGVIVINGK